MTTRAKRVSLVIGLLFVALFVGALVGAYMLSRDIHFDLGNPNVVEANNFRKKLRRYETAITNGTHGYVKFSQVEINSFIGRTMTNSTETGSGMHLRRMAVGLTDTNLMLYSWGEYRVANMPLKFVVQRGFTIRQEGTNQWEAPMDSLKIGEVEVPENWWPRLAAILEPLDQPVKDKFAWTTNIPALMVKKNELSKKPELTLYTYKPIPDEDRRK
jgi:hypothetical protein